MKRLSINHIASSLMMVMLLITMAPVMAAEKDDDAKVLSGISIIGNKEVPKSLYIVPWKNSEVGVESSLNSGLLDDSMKPVDKEVFIRELDFYEFSHGNQ